MNISVMISTSIGKAFLLSYIQVEISLILMVQVVIVYMAGTLETRTLFINIMVQGGFVWPMLVLIQMGLSSISRLLRPLG